MLSDALMQSICSVLTSLSQIGFSLDRTSSNGFSTYLVRKRLLARLWLLVMIFLLPFKFKIKYTHGFHFLSHWWVEICKIVKWNAGIVMRRGVCDECSSVCGQGTEGWFHLFREQDDGLDYCILKKVPSSDYAVVLLLLDFKKNR